MTIVTFYVHGSWDDDSEWEEEQLVEAGFTAAQAAEFCQTRNPFYEVAIDLDIDPETLDYKLSATRL